MRCRFYPAPHGSVKKPMKKIFALIIILALAIGGFFYWHKKPIDPLVSHSSNVRPPNVSTTQSQTTSQTLSTNADTPQTLLIPKLGLTAPIESVGLDSKGNMDTPEKADDVAWYNKGFRIGDNGSAVIAGHYDRVTGAPAVFYHLSSLTAGDTISVAMDSGKTFTFTVTKTTSFPDAQFPLATVFNTPGKPTLNLITCDGTWNASAKNYSNRLVVYSELKQ